MVVDAIIYSSILEQNLFSVNEHQCLFPTAEIDSHLFAYIILFLRLSKEAVGLADDADDEEEIKAPLRSAGCEGIKPF